METAVTTVTAVDSILSLEELITFQAAQETWKHATKNTLKNLESMATIGRAINMLYDKGDTKGMKREAITDMVRDNFEGLDRRDRSDYRKLADEYLQVKLFVEFAGIKSCNPSYLINSWRKAMTEDRVACELIETTLGGGVDVQGNIMALKEVEEVEAAEPQRDAHVESTLDILDRLPKLPKKEGFNNIVTPEPLTTKELTEQVGAVINQVKIAFNTGMFDADSGSLLLIENQLTSCLQHINNCEGDLIQEKVWKAHANH